MKIKIGDYFEGEKIVRIFNPKVSFDLEKPYFVTESGKKIYVQNAKIKTKNDEKER